MRTLHLRQNENLFRETINIIFMYLLAPFIVENFKESLEADPKLCGSIVLGPKWPIFPNE